MKDDDNLVWGLFRAKLNVYIFFILHVYITECVYLLYICNYMCTSFFVQDLKDTERGAGGFGSTGKN